MSTHRPWWVLALALVATVAEAQQADPQASAKEHYEKAARAYEVGKYDVAITEFQTTYELTGDPILLYNIAQAYKQKGDYREAVKLYKRYLSKVPNAKNKADVEKKITDLEAEIEKGGSAPPPPTGGEKPPGGGTQTGTTPGGGTNVATTTGDGDTGTSGGDVGPGGGDTGTGGDVSLGAGIQPIDKKIRIMAAGGLMISSVTTADPDITIDPKPVGTLLIGGSYAIPVEPVRIDVGLYGTFRVLPYDDSAGSQHLSSIYAATVFGGVRYPVLPELHLRGEVGLGFASWFGLDTGNPFTGGGMSRATGAMAAFVWRLGAGADYFVTDAIFVGASLAFGQTRPLNDLLSNVTESVSHFDLLLSAGYAL